ncbi:MAG: Gfo/Idh/MocA family oxidoreductase [Thermomicrobiales bacterium]|jgi:predicted dehydrogenase|nr:Gfo/Idh/MocA family oxidoreductase [Thermomicrobiales bacterium]
MTSYRFGIVGLSWITSEPAGEATHPVLGPAMPHTHLSGLARIPEATVVAGCDISADARQLFIERWDTTWPGLAVFDDYKRMLAETELDIVCVATPDHLHGQIVMDAAAAGVKGIFCEKPISTHTDEVDEMIAALDAHNVVCSVNHTRRWNPTWVAAREALRAGAIGDLVTVTGRLGGERAMLWRNLSHVIDMMNYFVDADPEWVVGELQEGFEEYGLRYHGDGGRDAALEPGANAYVAWNNGVRGVLLGMKRAVASLQVDLIGSTGTIQVTDQSATMQLQTDQGLVSKPIVPRYSRIGMEAAIADLINAVATGAAPQSPPLDARRTVSIIDGILASQAAGNTRVPAP